MPIDIRKVDAEIRRGLPNEEPLRARRWEIARFYAEDFRQFIARRDVKRESLTVTPLLRRVCEVLARDLYRQGPTRTLPGNATATKWLQECYRRHGVDALLMEADRLSCANQVAAVEVCPRVGEDADPADPVYFVLWGAEDFVVWTKPDDPRHVEAIAVIDQFDEQRRLRLWTATERRTYLTARLDREQTSGGTAFELATKEPNPYGVLPFAFIHHREPSRGFWSGSPGDTIALLNESINARLTESNESILHTKPIGTVSGARSDWNFPRDMRPGTFHAIPPSEGIADNVEAKAEYLEPPLGFLEADWADLEKRIDHVLEMSGCPKVGYRMVESTAKSGAALQQEQAPLTAWAESRQRPFSYYEDRLAKLVCRVAAIHLESNGVEDKVAKLVEAAESSEPIVLKWPDMAPPLMGPDRDAADQWRLDNRLTSRKRLLMERERLSDKEAQAELEEIAIDLEAEATIFASVDQIEIAAQTPPDATTDPSSSPPEPA